MTTPLTDRARKAAEEILRALCEDPTPSHAPTDERIAAIIERHMQEEWKYEGIPTGVRVLVAAEYHDGYPNRVGIGEVYVEDGKKEILVDDGIERFDVDLPLTVYAWRELPAPPPNVGKEAAPCPEK